MRPTYIFKRKSDKKESLFPTAGILPNRSGINVVDYHRWKTKKDRGCGHWWV